MKNQLENTVGIDVGGVGFSATAVNTIKITTRAHLINPSEKAWIKFIVGIISSAEGEEKLPGLGVS